MFLQQIRRVVRVPRYANGAGFVLRAALSCRERLNVANLGGSGRAPGRFATSSRRERLNVANLGGNDATGFQTPALDHLDESVWKFGDITVGARTVTLELWCAQRSLVVEDCIRMRMMRKVRAAAGTLVFLVLAPGIVAGVGPWWLTDWQVRQPSYWSPLRVGGLVLLGGGAVVLLRAFTRFVVEGLGTPAPVAPTERLVVGGLYRYVRNPMYLAVAATIVGQALWLGEPSLFLYAAAFLVVVATFVHTYEEPTLHRRFGAAYEVYRQAVPAWWPRREPWTGAEPREPSDPV